MMTETKAPKKMNLNLDADLADWVAFESAMSGVSQTRYVNDAIRRDIKACESKGGDHWDAYEAFVNAKSK